MSVISDVAEYLEDQGLGTVGQDIFESYLPGDVNSCIAVIDTGGLQPDRYLPTHEPTFQIIVRSTTYAGGAAKIESIRDALHQKANVSLIPGETYFYFIFAISEGGHIGRNEVGQDEFSMNFQARTR